MEYVLTANRLYRSLLPQLESMAVTLHDFHPTQNSGTNRC
jgi:hypothetical protein